MRWSPYVVLGINRPAFLALPIEHVRICRWIRGAKYEASGGFDTAPNVIQPLGRVLRSPREVWGLIDECDETTRVDVLVL